MSEDRGEQVSVGNVSDGVRNARDLAMPLLREAATDADRR